MAARSVVAAARVRGGQQLPAPPDDCLAALLAGRGEGVGRPPRRAGLTPRRSPGPPSAAGAAPAETPDGRAPR